MATAQNPATPKLRAGVQDRCAPVRGPSFLWRKLHSLLGIIPIGAFFVEHLLSNFEALKGPAAYGAQVKFPQCPASRPRTRVVIHILCPILYHGSMACISGCAGKSNVVYYPWAGNWMYVAQRWTGLVAAASTSSSTFCVSASWESAFLKIPASHLHKVQQELANPVMLAVYVIAMIAICWHFAYGIWLFAAKWGITPGRRRSQALGIRMRRLRRRPADHGTRQHLGLRQSSIRKRTRNRTCSNGPNVYPDRVVLSVIGLLLRLYQGTTSVVPKQNSRKGA